MEPNTPVTPQPVPNPIIPTPPPVTATLTPVAPSKKSPLLLLLLVILAISAAAVFAFMSYSKSNPSQTASPSTSTPVANEPVLSSPLPVIENSETKLAYLRDPNTEVMGDNETYLIDVNTLVETKLDLKNVLNVYKHINSTKLYYFTGENDGSIRVYDLKLGTNSTFKLLSHPLDSVRESISINSIDSISPSGNYLVFQAGFYEDCPSMAPFPSGFEGGYGPCMPDESLDYPTGNYLFDVKASKATPLIELFRVSRWDEAGHKLYYITDSTTKALDLTSNTISLFDNTSLFGYFVYPLLKSDTYVKLEGSTEKGVRIFLTNADRKELGDIESEKPWAILQPFIQSSPNEKNIIYVKTELDSQSFRHNYLYKYDLDKKVSTALTPTDKNTNYSTALTWLDDHTFITTEQLVNPKDYTKPNRNLVKIDINSGELIPLTTHSNVYQFNIQ